MGMSFFISCQEEGLVVNGNDVSYINFNKDITKDTTRICFEFYPMEEGMDVKIAEVKKGSDEIEEIGMSIREVKEKRREAALKWARRNDVWILFFFFKQKTAYEM